MADVIDVVNGVCKANRRRIGFGKEQSPHDLETIADLQKIAELLSDRNYSDEDITGIMHGNWINFFKRNLP